MLKSLFDKCVKLATSKFADYSLAIVSFIESSFFPVPPDIMIVPMVVAKKEKYFKIFLIATLFSSLGALLGYFIGFLFFNELGIKVFEFYGYNNTDFLKDKFQTSSGSFSWLLILFTAAFTPLPFKLVAIFSGFIQFNLVLFFFTCLLARGLRFFVVAYLSFRFGSTFSSFLEKKGAFWATVIGLTIVILALIVYLVIKYYV
ncbi:VTT domain-containing protein [Pelagibacteraceae bacterium]|jgi:membrane protein YqaA with SNARE-associated domain|nr:VTT domain-containing protein [Pelagibacteraceae bacterium]